jgi:hypothetical protein
MRSTEIQENHEDRRSQGWEPATGGPAGPPVALIADLEIFSATAPWDRGRLARLKQRVHSRHS